MSHPSKKRRLERPASDSDRAAIFDGLGHEDENVRIQAAAKLLSRLGDSNVDDELRYAMKRLFRGLCSSRKAARLGFSVALTEVLSQHTSITLSDILDLWIELTNTSGQMEGQEARDHVMGRVFGAEAIVQSGILFREPADQDSWKQVLNALFALANKKVWVREECGWVALLGIQKAKADSLDSKWATTVLHLLGENRLTNTSEGVALWIAAEKCFPSLAKPNNAFEGGDPLSSKSRAKLVKILREETTHADANGTAKQPQRSTWSARPHFAWEIIFQTLPEDRYRDFWREVVDEGLFSKASSSERKHWGLSLFSQQAALLPAIRLPDILTINFCRCLSNQIAAKDRYLHSASNRCVAAILERAEADAQVVGPFLVRVSEDDIRSLFASGQLKTRLLDKVVAFADVSAVAALVKSMKKPGKGTNRHDSDNVMARLDMLCSIIRTITYPAQEGQNLKEVRHQYDKVIERLVVGAYAGSADVQLSSQGDKNQAKARSKLWACLATLPLKDPVSSYYPQSAVRFLQTGEESTKSSVIADAAVKKSIKRAYEVITNLGEHGEAIAKSLDALRLLLCLCVIQVYNGEADALEALDDLHHCYRDMEADSASEDRSRASVTIIEMLLSFASRPSTLFKNVAQQAFSMCLDLVNEESVASMVRVLETEETLAGQNEMFEDEDDDADEGGNLELSEESEGGEGDSDVEMVDAEGDASNDSEASGGSGDSDREGEDSNTSDDNDDEIEQFDAKLAEALGTRRADRDLANESEESSESDMDDEQMEALDEHISLMFRQRKQAETKSKKKEQKEAKENITIFKTRVLDLVKIYTEERHQNFLALDFTLPLLHLIRSTQNKALSEKAAGIVRDFSKHVKLVAEADASGSLEAKPSKRAKKRSKELLKAVHSTAIQQGSNMFQSACSQASLLLVKIFLSNGGSIDDAINIYGDTQNIFMTDGKCGIKTSFFTDWLNWCTSARQKLAK